MLPRRIIVHFLIAVAQFLTGVCANGFIVVVNVRDLIRQRHAAPLDLLLCCLATSRICLQLFIFFLCLALESFVKQSELVKFYIVFIFTYFWGLWLATWLGVFYCAKIATIPHPLFFWLKMRISKLVPWLILGSTLYAAITSAIHEKHLCIIAQNVLANMFSKNATQVKRIGVIPLSILIFELTVPSVMFFIAVLLLIFSLGRHAQQMGTTAVGTRGPCRGGPVRAMLSILPFLTLYFSLYMMAVLFFFEILQLGSLFFEFFNFVAGTYPSIHSVLLILGNAKLKQNAKRLLPCGQCGP